MRSIVRCILALSLTGLVSFAPHPAFAAVTAPQADVGLMTHLLYPVGWYVAGDGEAKPVLVGKLEDQTRNDSTVVYTLAPHELTVGSKYQMSGPDAVRSDFIDKGRWLVSEHESVGDIREYWDEGEDFWPERVAIQVCIWSENSDFTLDSDTVPDELVLRRAQELCDALDEAATAGQLETVTVHRRIDLSLEVVRSTATTVTVEARLVNRDTGSGLEDRVVEVSYDGLSEPLRTDSGGMIRRDYPRHDRKVLATARYEGKYNPGVTWASVDGAQPVVITGETLTLVDAVELRVDPATLIKDTDLLYQTVSEFVADRTPLPPQPGAAVGLLILGFGWVIVAVRMLGKLLAPAE